MKEIEEKNDDGLIGIRDDVKYKVLKQKEELTILKAKNTQKIISEYGKKGGPASSVYDVKINLFNDEEKPPYFKTLTDETIDEAAALFDKLFVDDSDQNNFSRNIGILKVNGVSVLKNAQNMAQSMGMDILEYDFSDEKGLKLQKALFIHAIASKNSKITLEGLDEKGEHKDYEIKLPGKTAAQKKNEEKARALVEEDRKRYNGMREDEIPGFDNLEKDIYDSRNEILSFSFNSGEARNNPHHQFDPRKLDKAEYEKALALYDKIFKRFKDQKAVIEPPTSIVYKSPSSINPYHISFNVNGKKHVSETYLKTVQKLSEYEQSITENDQKVAVIYLMPRFTFSPVSLDRKRVDFCQVTSDMEPPKNFMDEAGRTLGISSSKKTDKEDIKADDNKINDEIEERKPVDNKIKDVKEEKKIISTKKLSDLDIIQYNNYQFFAVVPGTQRTPEQKIDAISEVMSACALKASGIKYDEKKIGKIAKHFKELYCLDDFKGEPSFNNCDVNVENALKFGEAARKKIYSVPRDKYHSYSDEMKELLQNMQSKKGRTDEYKQLYDAIEAASKLNEKTASMGNAEKATAYRNSNIRIVEAVKKYIKGKKSARIITSRKDRFDNALDALAIIVKANPNAAIKIDKMIGDINKHRGVDKKINADTFTTTYGVERAKTRGAIYNKGVEKNDKNVNVKKGSRGIGL